jgi:cell wall-associated NlpC family hydrolase
MSAQRLGVPARLLTVQAAAVALTVGLTIAPNGASAEAAVVSVRTKALNVAASKKGAPYQYGAAGPRRFDCSGLVQYSYKVAGKRLPRTSRQQASAARRISASQARPGDLVFFYSGGRVYHVGIYAGRGYVWHSPKAGDHVRKAKIWTKRVYYGRVG